MADAVRRGVLFVLGLNSLFMVLDIWWATDSVFWRLFGCRLALDGAVVALYVATPWMRPVQAAVAGFLATGAGMLAVIVAAGGVGTDYWPALMLLFLGAPVQLPLSGRQIAWPAVLLLVGFAFIPVLTGESVELRRFLVPLFFSLSGATVCLASCAILDGYRYREYVQRREIEAARDQLAQLDRVKSRFTANVHHELRTPLTLMLAPLEAMLSGDFGEVSEQQSSYLRTMHVNGLRLLKLINNLLDLAKIESGQHTIHRRACDMGRVARDVVTGARPLAEQKGIRLVGEGLDTLPQIHGDGDALEKVVVNLVGNALKFTGPGGTITVSGEDTHDGGVRIVVSDTGVGLEPDQCERIFDRFAQVDTSATRKHEGTGIGLSLVKELVEAHGGRVWAQSPGLGRGAQMFVELPQGESDGEEDQEVLRTEDGTSVALGSSLGAVSAELNVDGRMVEMQRTVERWEGEGDPGAAGHGEPEIPSAPDGAPEILIVEDNSDMRRLLQFVVGREYRVRVARNGREGLEEVQREAPDLVLTDVMMPEMSGIELCTALKGDAATAAIPVVLVTSKAEREMKIAGLEGGADDYVSKPFHPRELLARVRSLVRLRQLQSDLETRNTALERMNHELGVAMKELKEAEIQVLQSERLAAVGELAAGVAHEVNNPVNFALNSLRTMRKLVQEIVEAAGVLSAVDASDPEKVLAQARALEGLAVPPEETAAELKELVGIVTEGLERTSRLVGNLRDLASPTQGVRVPVDLRAGIESTLTLLRRSLDDAGVAVELHLPDEPLRVNADAGALNQVFLNLVKNSAEAMEGRAGTIWIEGSKQDGHVSVVLHDNGPGVSQEARDRLFEPFFTTKVAGRGSGLGLSICQRIVAEHGGTIVLSSPPGEGATFAIRLPEEGAERSDGA